MNYPDRKTLRSTALARLAGGKAAASNQILAGLTVSNNAKLLHAKIF
jgi:hypothetical protein